MNDLNCYNGDTGDKGDKGELGDDLNMFSGYSRCYCVYVSEIEEQTPILSSINVNSEIFNIDLRINGDKKSFKISITDDQNSDDCVVLYRVNAQETYTFVGNLLCLGGMLEYNNTHEFPEKINKITVYVLSNLNLNVKPNCYEFDENGTPLSLILENIEQNINFIEGDRSFMGYNLMHLLNSVSIYNKILLNKLLMMLINKVKIIDVFENFNDKMSILISNILGFTNNNINVGFFVDTITKDHDLIKYLENKFSNIDIKEYQNTIITIFNKINNSKVQLKNININFIDYIDKIHDKNKIQLCNNIICSINECVIKFTEITLNEEKRKYESCVKYCDIDPHRSTNNLTNIRNNLNNNINKIHDKITNNLCKFIECATNKYYLSNNINTFTTVNNIINYLDTIENNYIKIIFNKLKNKNKNISNLTTKNLKPIVVKHFDTLETIDISIDVLCNTISNNNNIIIFINLFNKFISIFNSNIDIIHYLSTDGAIDSIKNNKTIIDYNIFYKCADEILHLNSKDSIKYLIDNGHVMSVEIDILNNLCDIVIGNKLIELLEFVKNMDVSINCLNIMYIETIDDFILFLSNKNENIKNLININNITFDNLNTHSILIFNKNIDKTIYINELQILFNNCKTIQNKNKLKPKLKSKFENEYTSKMNILSNYNYSDHLNDIYLKNNINNILLNDFINKKYKYPPHKYIPIIDYLIDKSKKQLKDDVFEIFKYFQNNTLNEFITLTNLNLNYKNDKNDILIKNIEYANIEIIGQFTKIQISATCYGKSIVNLIHKLNITTIKEFINCDQVKPIQNHIINLLLDIINDDIDDENIQNTIVDKLVSENKNKNDCYFMDYLPIILI
jgi:hypothetical protein